MIHLLRLLHLYARVNADTGETNIMTALAHRQPPPTPQGMALARESARNLARLAVPDHPLRLRSSELNASDQVLELPAAAVALLMDVLEAMAAGRGVMIIPENAELTTVQAAALLNVSRPFLINLLENGSIPHRKVGRHRRLRMEDIMAYKQQITRQREAVLDELAAEAQAEDMGYRL